MFPDHGAGEHRLEAGTAAIFEESGIGRRAQPLERRGIGIERMAGEIKADGGELFAQPLMRRPVGDREQPQSSRVRSEPPPNRLDCPLSRSRALRAALPRMRSADSHQLAAIAG